MVSSKALKAKLLLIPSEVASLSTPSLDQDWKNCYRCAFVQPPVMVIAPAHEGPRWRAPLNSGNVVRMELWVLSLSVEEGRSTFGVIAGIWAKF